MHQGRAYGLSPHSRIVLLKKLVCFLLEAGRRVLWYDNADLVITILHRIPDVCHILLFLIPHHNLQIAFFQLLPQ